MGSFSKNVALLVLGFWLGVVVLFAAVVAPTLFPKKTVQSEAEHMNVVSGLSKDVAGAIAGSILRKIYLITYGCSAVAGFFLFLAWFGESKGAAGPKRALVLTLILLGLNITNDLWLRDKMAKIKLAMANSPETPTLKVEFNRWHQVSMYVYGGTMLCGAIAAFCLLPSFAGAGRRFSK